MKTLTLTIVLAFAVNAQAKTDVGAALEQVKTNEVNAKANKKQYDENVEIANKNIAEVTAAIKTLRDQKTQLTTNAANLEKNRAVVNKMKEKLNDYAKEEGVALKKEEEQIAKLKATLDKLEANKRSREDNIAAYQQKIVDVEKEQAEWEAQKQTFVQIQKELDSKEGMAVAERDKWMQKRKGYQTEATKWERESEIAEQNRVKYEKLKN